MSHKREGAIRCQCTLASESQIKDLFRQYAQANPGEDIDYDYVSSGLSAIGQKNAAEGVKSAGPRNCFGCDPLVNALVRQFNETHDAEALFVRKRQGGRAAKLALSSGLCAHAQERDYSGKGGEPPILTGTPIAAPKRHKR